MLKSFAAFEELNRTVYTVLEGSWLVSPADRLLSSECAVVTVMTRKFSLNLPLSWRLTPILPDTWLRKDVDSLTTRLFFLQRKNMRLCAMLRTSVQESLRSQQSSQ